MDFIASKKNYDLVSCGEVMLRLSPPDKEKISHGNLFEKNAGGSEFNVASGASFLGIRSAIITKLPDNKIGRFIKYKIRYGNVSDDHILYDESDEKRLGIYYYESGAYPRKSSVVYDRALSSFNSITLDEIDPEVFKNTRMFHISGITLAISPNLRAISVELIKKFKENGASISFDVNYRASLWSEEEARDTIKSILPYVDVLFISEETSRKMMQKTGSLEEIMKSYTEEYDCKIILTTRREVVSPTKHNFGSIIYYNGKYYEEEHYKNIEVVDRIGSGDAYVAGALYGILKHGDCQKALEFGNAMSAVKNTVNGDMAISSLDEIQSVIDSHKDTGNQSEMNR
ncbi:MAG: sugar kinase [bacterium]